MMEAIQDQTGEKYGTGSRAMQGANEISAHCKNKQTCHLTGIPQIKCPIRFVV